MLGHAYKQSPLQLYRSFHPKYYGLGIFTFFVNAFLSLYYNNFMAYFFVYFFLSFISPLPFSSSQESEIFYERSYFQNEVIKTTESIGITGPFNPLVYKNYVLSFIIIYFCIAKGVKISGKIAVYTGTLPFVLLIILIFRALFLDGAI